jgi:hypothetical protein
MNTPGENWFDNQFCLDRSTAYCLFSNGGSESVPWSQAQGYTEIGWDDGTDETALVMLDYLWANVGGSWQQPLQPVPRADVERSDKGEPRPPP